MLLPFTLQLYINIRSYINAGMDPSKIDMEQKSYLTSFCTILADMPRNHYFPHSLY